MQTRVESLVERTFDTVLAFIISCTVAYYLLPIFGAEQSAANSIQFVFIFTAISFVRGYFVRRMFNAITVRKYGRSANPH